MDLPIATIEAKMKNRRRFFAKMKRLADSAVLSESPLPPPRVCAWPGCHELRLDDSLFCGHKDCAIQRLNRTKNAQKRPTSHELYKWNKSTQVQNRFFSVAALFRDLRIVRKDMHQWYLTDQIYGAINALPQSHGLLVASNGVDCIIKTLDSHFVGHIAWFVPDVVIDSESEDHQEPKPKKLSKKQVALLQAYEV